MCFSCFFQLHWLPLCWSSVSTQTSRAAVKTALLSLYILGSGSVLFLLFNMMLWVSPPCCASVSLQFHSTQLNPSHSQRKALVSSSGLWLTSIFTPQRWPVSLCQWWVIYCLNPGQMSGCNVTHSSLWNFLGLFLEFPRSSFVENIMTFSQSYLLQFLEQKEL